jgi:hypothetical protein
MEMEIHVLMYGSQFVGYGFVEKFDAFVAVFHGRIFYGE